MYSASTYDFLYDVHYQICLSYRGACIPTHIHICIHAFVYVFVYVYKICKINNWISKMKSLRKN